MRNSFFLYERNSGVFLEIGNDRGVGSLFARDLYGGILGVNILSILEVNAK